MSLPRKQSGVALVVVLWLSVRLTIVVGSFAIVARTENLQARHLFDTTRATYAAEAGLRWVIEDFATVGVSLRLRRPAPRLART